MDSAVNLITQQYNSLDYATTDEYQISDTNLIIYIFAILAIT